MMAHNSAQFIGEAIESVLSQEMQEWELLIADDASDDATADAVRPYLRDARIRYHRHDVNIGQANNWWFLIEHARAPVFARLDGDDAWFPTTAARMVGAHSAGADIYYGAWVRFYQDQGHLAQGPRIRTGESTGVSTYALQIRHNSALQGAMSYRTDLARHAGMPLPELKYMVDYEYVLRLLAIATRVVGTSEPLLRYRVHAASATAAAQASLGYLEERARLYDACRRHVGLNPAIAEHLSVLWITLCREDFSDGLSEAVRRDWEAGVAIMRDAVRRCPTLLRSPKVIMDLALACLGHTGRRAMRVIHRHRVMA